MVIFEKLRNLLYILIKNLPIGGAYLIVKVPNRIINRHSVFTRIERFHINQVPNYIQSNKFSDVSTLNNNVPSEYDQVSQLDDQADEDNAATAPEPPDDY